MMFEHPKRFTGFIAGTWDIKKGIYCLKCRYHKNGVGSART